MSLAQLMSIMIPVMQMIDARDDIEMIRIDGKYSCVTLHGRKEILELARAFNETAYTGFYRIGASGWEYAKTSFIHDGIRFDAIYSDYEEEV